VTDYMPSRHTGVKFFERPSTVLGTVPTKPIIMAQADIKNIILPKN